MWVRFGVMPSRQPTSRSSGTEQPRGVSPGALLLIPSRIQDGCIHGVHRLPQAGPAGNQSGADIPVCAGRGQAGMPAPPSPSAKHGLGHNRPGMAIILTANPNQHPPGHAPNRRQTMPDHEVVKLILATMLPPDGPGRAPSRSGAPLPSLGRGACRAIVPDSGFPYALAC